MTNGGVGDDLKVYRCACCLPAAGTKEAKSTRTISHPRLYRHTHTDPTIMMGITAVSRSLEGIDSGINRNLNPQFAEKQASHLANAPEFALFDWPPLLGTHTSTANYVNGEPCDPDPGRERSPAVILQAVEEIITHKVRPFIAACAWLAGTIDDATWWSGATKATIDWKPFGTEGAGGSCPMRLPGGGTECAPDDGEDGADEGDGDGGEGDGGEGVDGEGEGGGGDRRKRRPDASTAKPGKRNKRVNAMWARLYRLLRFHIDIGDNSGRWAPQLGTGSSTIMATPVKPPESGKYGDGTAFILCGVHGQYPKDEAWAKQASISAASEKDGARRFVFEVKEDPAICLAYAGGEGLPHGGTGGRDEPTTVRSILYQSEQPAAISWARSKAGISKVGTCAECGVADMIFTLQQRRSAEKEGRCKPQKGYRKTHRKLRQLSSSELGECIEWIRVYLAQDAVLGLVLRASKWIGDVDLFEAMMDNLLIGGGRRAGFAPAVLFGSDRRAAGDVPDLLQNIGEAWKEIVAPSGKLNARANNILSRAILRLMVVCERMNEYAHHAFLEKMLEDDGSSLLRAFLAETDESLEVLKTAAHLHAAQF